MLHGKHMNIRSYLGDSRKLFGIGPAFLVLLSLALFFGFQRTDEHVILSSALIIPLYSSFSKEAILENMNRRLILSVIKKHGGITFTEIKNELGLQNGVLAYHLSLLEKNHYIKSFSDGKFKRFYSKGTVMTGLTSTEELIMAIIESNPNISRRRIAQLMEYSQGTVNSTIQKLVKKDLINMKKIGKHYAYYPKN